MCAKCRVRVQKLLCVRLVCVRVNRRRQGYWSFPLCCFYFYFYSRLLLRLQLLLRLLVFLWERARTRPAHGDVEEDENDENENESARSLQEAKQSNQHTHTHTTGRKIGTISRELSATTQRAHTRKGDRDATAFQWDAHAQHYFHYYCCCCC